MNAFHALDSEWARLRKDAINRMNANLFADDGSYLIVEVKPPTPEARRAHIKRVIAGTTCDCADYDY